MQNNLLSNCCTVTHSIHNLASLPLTSKFPSYPTLLKFQTQTLMSLFSPSCSKFNPCITRPDAQTFLSQCLFRHTLQPCGCEVWSGCSRSENKEWTDLTVNCGNALPKTLVCKGSGRINIPSVYGWKKGH